MILKTESEDNKLGRVANAVKNKTKKMNERISRAKKCLLPFLNPKLGTEGLFAKCTMPIHFKRMIFDPFSIPRKASSYAFFLMIFLEKLEILRFVVLY